MLYVDQRWQGRHGIGRFALEVSSRLTIGYESLTNFGTPSSPLDVISPARLRLRAGDLVYSPGYNAGPTRATQILTLHDLIHLHSESRRARLLKSYYELVVRPTVSRAGSVFTVSRTSANVIEEWLNDSSVQVVNVGNGCSDIFSPMGDPASIPSPYFLYVGNLKPHKNFDVLLKALRKRPEYSLVAIINDSANAEAAIEHYGLGARVRVVSGISDVELAELYRGSIGLLMPSLTEGFGLPAVESLSCGRAVAYSKACASVAEIVGDFGVAVEDGVDVEEWANAMDALAESELSFTHPDEKWRNQYKWSNVAGNVSNHLMSLHSSNARNV